MADNDTSEDVAFKEEAKRRLEKAKADEKRIKEEIKALKKAMKEGRKTKEGKVIDFQWAGQEIAEYKDLLEVAKRKKGRLDDIIRSETKQELPELIDFHPKPWVYYQKEVKIKISDNEQPKEDKRQTLRPSLTEEDIYKTAAVRKSAVGQKPQQVGKREENARLKEVARGVSSVALEQQNRQLNSLEKGGLANAEKSYASQREQMKIERQQELIFKKLQKENEKGITASKTEGLSVNKDGKKEDKTKVLKTAGDDKKISDELHHAELEKKIENLREKLEKLQAKRMEQAQKTTLKSPNENMDKIKFSAEEAKALPSVKASEAMKKAFEAKELPEAEKGGVVSESSLSKMEEAVHQAEEKVKTATLVPDYATPEFKKKAEEQGIEQRKTKKEKAADRQKLLALSGRTISDKSSENEENSRENDRTDERQEFRIDPEKSRQMSAEKSGKEINMQQYQEMKRLKGGRMTG